MGEILDPLFDMKCSAAHVEDERAFLREIHDLGHGGVIRWQATEIRD
jgi:hypothetical protein